MGRRKKFHIANIRPCLQSQLKEPVVRLASVKSRVSGLTQGVFPAISALVDRATE